ncbi:MAG: leucine--tRNA ligase, partial [bacterium]|nr:leucine--tRNA ligase [bacterium]
MAKSYDHRRIEKKWQEKWKKDRLYETPDTAKGKKNFYALVELPYTSGDLHIGHWYAFAVPDVFARMKSMQGYNVLYPIGFDTFGLPAENAAIKNKADPAQWTQKNIDRMRKQLYSIGNAFDWRREVVTCDPSYYRWTQWLFLKFYEKGLAYRGKALVNWDPVDKTVLANEQVLPDGTGERSGAKIEKKELEQWFLKITDYADRLIDDLEPLDWPEPIKESQRNWIGRSEGAEIDFQVVFENGGKPGTIPVFTTRPDTLPSATFFLFAPEHLWVTLAIDDNHVGMLKNRDEVRSYVAAAKAKSDIDRSGAKEKTGIELKGVKAVNPLTKEEIPIFVADYVLGGYGTGAVMGVPAHDERDRMFAEKFKLPVKEVTLEDPKKIVEKVSGRWKKNYKLRDWLISRQRYWGSPIPIIYDPEGKPHPIPEKHLPWLLPSDVDFTPTGVPPLARSQELLERTEKIFGKGWKPETDTMDGFVDNSWYFLRYLDPKNEKEFSSLEKQKLWMPIARYSGGTEHTTVHVLYSRFFYKALFDMGLVTSNEPYAVRMNRGIILGEDGRKMSKRWGNVVNPDEQVENVGADAVRTYLAFIGPYNEVGSYPWNTNGLIGVRRFLERATGLSEKVSNVPIPEHISILLNQTIKKVDKDIEAMKFNTSVSQLMIFSNELQKLDAVPREAYEIFVKLLAPFAPHLAEELWEELGHDSSVHLEKWPVFDASKLEKGMVVVVVQISGKTRGTVS